MATRRASPEEGPVAGEQEGEGAEAGSGESLGTLFRGIIAESTSLVRQEIELARAELGEKMALLQRQVTAMAFGSALLVCAFFLLLSALDRGFTTALASWMDDRIAVWLAPLILAALLGGVGFWLLTSARRTLKQEGLVPEQTVETLQENTTWIKERLQ